MGSTALYAVSVVDASLSSFGIAVEILQVVVEIHRASAEITAKKGSVGGEDGGDVDAALLAERKRDTGQPLVELSNDSALLFMVDVLQGISLLI